MPQISPTEFYALPLRAHTFLADVPLHDVWAVDLPTHHDGVTLSEFLRGRDRAESTDFRQCPARLSVFGFFLDAFFGLRPNRTMPWQPPLEVA
jgi:hypothetical protein